MKILFISDDVDPLVYSVNAKKRYADIDLVISSGDLPARYYEFILSTLNKPLFFVNGNHKGIHPPQESEAVNLNGSPDFNREYFGECVDGKVVYLKKQDLIIAGLGGCMRYNNGIDQYSEAEMKRRMNRLVPALYMNKMKHGRYVDILVTHAAPFGVCDGEDLCHRGFRCFNTFIEKFSPELMVHGHVHVIDQNKRPVTECHGTKVINVYQSYVLEINR